MAKYLRYLTHEFEQGSGWPLTSTKNCLSSSVYDLFLIELSKIKSSDVSKLSIIYCNDPKRHYSYEQILDILVVQYYYDLDHVLELDELNQKEFFLESIQKTFHYFAPQFEWEVDHVDNVIGKIISDGIVFDRYWKKPVRNRATGATAQIHVKYEAGIELSIVIRDKKKNITHKKHMMSLGATMGALHSVHGKLEWISDDLVRLTEKAGRDYWEYDLDKDEVTFFFPRADSRDPHALYDLGRMYLRGGRVQKDKERGLRLIKEAADKKFKHAIRFLEKLKA